MMATSSKAFTLGIVGAGIMGRTLAWLLSKSGHHVTLFDKDAASSGSASAFTAAGMLTPYCEVESAETRIFEMGLQSLDLWAQFVNDLEGDCGFHQQGSLVISHQQDIPHWHQFNRQLTHKLPGETSQFQTLEYQAIHSLEPELATVFDRATYLPDEAWLCTHKTMSVLHSNLIAAGVNWFDNTEVEELAPGYIKTSSDEYTFDWVIDTRGMGAKEQWSALRGVRGEVIWLQAKDVRINRLVRLMHPRYRLYLVPKGYDDLYIIGATQIESNDTGPVTVHSVLELLSAVYSLHSGFSEARVVKMLANCRPALPDNMPSIQTTEGFIRINGLYRHGFLLSPLLANEVTSWLTTSNYQSTFESLFTHLEN